MDDQAVLSEAGPILHKAIWAVKTVRMVAAHSLDLALHVFATMALHWHFTSSSDSPCLTYSVKDTDESIIVQR